MKNYYGNLFLCTFLKYKGNYFSMLKKFLPLFLLLSFAKTVEVRAQEKEATLKAAFIFNFTKYIDWDTTRNNDDFVIGVIGPSAVTPPLADIAKDNLANNKRIVIRQFSKPDEITWCNILFIPQKNHYLLQNILDRTGKGTLTISEEEGYAKQGTAFNFVIINDKLKFESNLNAINAAGLKASSQLLKLAILVY